MADNLVDPLLILLRRHEAANLAFDTAASNDASEAERNRLFDECTRTMRAIIDWTPTAMTAESAAAALDHVLNDEAFEARDNVGVFLRHLISAARDYIVRTAENP